MCREEVSPSEDPERTGSLERMVDTGCREWESGIVLEWTEVRCSEDVGLRTLACLHCWVPWVWGTPSRNRADPGPAFLSCTHHIPVRFWPVSLGRVSWGQSYCIWEQTGEHLSASQLLGCPADEGFLVNPSWLGLWWSLALVRYIFLLTYALHLRGLKRQVQLDAMTHACNPALSATQTGKVQG